jgi:predicted NBD/HSP70 family sugar kinase
MEIDNGKIVAAVDIGAGRGAKIEIAKVVKSKIIVLGESLYLQKNYGNSAKSFFSGLVKSLKNLASRIDVKLKHVCSLGIDLPGFLDANQNIQKCVNLPFLNGSNLRSPIEDSLGVPVSLINDGNSGALAEWSVRKKELVYWAFGGGWGGSWISDQGDIKFPTTHWHGKDQDIHISDEPGYKAEIAKDQAALIFLHHGQSFDKFLNNLALELSVNRKDLKGPDGHPDSLRAEVLVSGQGLWRIFNSIITDHQFSAYSKTEQQILRSSDTAGPLVSELYDKGDASARTAFQIMSHFFEICTLSILNQLIKEGARDDIPIYLGGGMANAFDRFTPLAQQGIYKSGYNSKLQKSHFLDIGKNANLIGAIWLAMRYSPHKTKIF